MNKTTDRLLSLDALRGKPENIGNFFDSLENSNTFVFKK